MKILTSLLALTTCLIFASGGAHAAALIDFGAPGAVSSDWLGAALGLPLVLGLCLISARQ